MLKTNEEATSPRMAEPADPQLEKLRAHLRSMKSVLVCFSGGVDSALVLAVAHETLGSRAVGMTAVSPSLAPFEKEAAIAIAAQIGARHELVDSNEIERAGYVANAPDRCFHCKSELYDIASTKAREWTLDWVTNGTNLDDLTDHRPGLEAAKNTGVRSVLVECGFHKDDVRRCARLVGLAVWDKPASACLSSRIPYGTAVTRERLAQIGGLEAELRVLGLRQVRVRWHALRPAPSSTAQLAPHDDGRRHGEGAREQALARIEVGRSELSRAFDQRDAIVDAGKRFGFAYVTLDLQGYRTGSHNEVVVAGRSLRVI
jgi:pyridinium-3,5-biscarboxylic acid mononucleotide sulfurtransferase